MHPPSALKGHDRRQDDSAHRSPRDTLLHTDAHRSHASSCLLAHWPLVLRKASAGVNTESRARRNCTEIAPRVPLGVILHCPSRGRITRYRKPNTQLGVLVWKKPLGNRAHRDLQPSEPHTPSVAPWRCRLLGSHCEQVEPRLIFNRFHNQKC